MASKWATTHRVRILGVQYRRLAPEYKIVALGTKRDSYSASKEYEREYVAVLGWPSARMGAVQYGAYLFSALEEKVKRLIPIRGGRAQEW